MSHFANILQTFLHPLASPLMWQHLLTLRKTKQKALQATRGHQNVQQLHMRWCPTWIINWPCQCYLACEDTLFTGWSIWFFLLRPRFVNFIVVTLSLDTISCVTFEHSHVPWVLQAGLLETICHKPLFCKSQKCQFWYIRSIFSRFRYRCVLIITRLIRTYF